MTKCNLSIFFLLLFTASNFFYVFASSKDEMNEYDIRKIPVILLKDADVVIRKKITKFEVQNETSAELTVKYAVTLFKNTKKKYGQLVLEYDNFRQIDDLDGAIYDAEGNEIRTLEDNDIKDYSGNVGYSLYEDNRVKVAELYYDRLPYTVEFTYTISYDGYLSWPEWYTRHSIQPVEYTSFKVLIPADQNLRYWINADSLQPKILNIDDNKSYFWEAKNQIKLSSEVYNDDIEDVAGIVKIAPKNFEIEDYKGNMTSWKNFGLWYYDLYKNRLTLSPEAQKEIQSKVNSNENLNNKVIKLYKYMQSKTRYVNITLGIGGWQPLEASYVYNHGYGDCKALSNFIISILKTANIKAYPVLINHGHEGIPFINKFPSNQFNHVIVCVPFKKDTMWLECTSQTTQAGFLGSGSENRGALMITPNGGVVVNTPKSIAEKNIQKKIIEVSLENGNAYAKADIKWIGDQQDYVRNVILEESPKEKEIWIKKLFEVPDIKVNSSVFNEDEEGVNLKGNFGLYKYASLSGKRIFFNPNLMERRSYVPAVLTEKLSPQRFYYPYIDIDSATYTIPQNYKVESLPDEVNLKSSFGSFLEKTVSDSTGKVCFLRRLEVDTYEIPAKNYDEYQKFFSKVVKADRSKVVLIKNEK